MLLVIGKILLVIFLWPILLAGALHVSNDMMFIAYIVNIIWIVIIAVFR